MDVIDDELYKNETQNVNTHKKFLFCEFCYFAIFYKNI